MYWTGLIITTADVLVALAITRGSRPTKTRSSKPSS
jgi:hypothetical protein